MSAEDINYKTAGLYNSLIEDYLSGELNKKEIVNWDYSLDEIHQKSTVRKFENRQVLHDVLIEQYHGVSLGGDENSKVKNNLDSLLNPATYTICTGHQLCIYGGPAYFYSKMIDAIELAKELNKQHPDQSYVPVFWLASEDHDFEEIQSVNLFNKKIKWEHHEKGAVGTFTTNTFAAAHAEWTEILGSQPKAVELNTVFTNAYQSGKSLAEATRLLAHELFKDEGLLIIDGDDIALKRLFLPVAIKELTDSVTEQTVNEQIKNLSGYKIQANPRSTNLFYLANNYRSRLIVERDIVSTADAAYSWKLTDFLNVVEKKPECISPNVFLRPLYQEICLPNVAYVGGAGEISYWLELPLLFKASSIDFPVPVVRNSYVYLNKKQLSQIEQLQLQVVDFFQEEHQILDQFIENNQEKTIDLAAEKQELANFFSTIEQIGTDIDQNLSKSVQGELKKCTSSIENLEKRFNNALKNKKTQEKQQITNLKSKLFPNGIFQERTQSIFDFVLKSEKNVFELIQTANKPLNNNIKVIVY